MTPQLTVLLTHHLNQNDPYLDLTLQSLQRQKGALPFEVIVLSDAEVCPLAPSDYLVVHDRTLINSTRKIKKGVQLAHPQSQFYLFLSDDVVLAEHTLQTLVETLGTAQAICNPMSNSDQGSQFHATWMAWHPDMTLDQVNLEEIFRFPAHPRTLIQKPYVCFYCTLIPKSVYEKTGELDERLEVRHNDQDYCYRAAQLGIPSFINLGAFAFHFGSRTLSQVASDQEKNQATRVFREKWEKLKDGHQFL